MRNQSDHILILILQAGFRSVAPSSMTHLFRRFVLTSESIYLLNTSNNPKKIQLLD